MFVACPHCGYLVALIVAKDGPARACPRCGGSLQSEAPVAVAAQAAAAEGAGTARDAVAEAPAASLIDDAPVDEGIAANAAAATPASAPASVPVGDEISRSLRRAGTAEAATQAGHAASVRDPAARAAPADDAAPSAAAKPQPSASEHDEAAASAAEAHDTAAADMDKDAAQATSAAAIDIDTARTEPEPAALPPLTGAAATAAPPARGRRQRKSETTVTSARRAPSFARQQARAQAPKPRLHWSGALAIAALVLALALQLLLAQRAELAADARWRPLVSGLCGALGCSVPAWHEPAALTMLNRNVLPLAERAGALRVSAGFRNDARWAQPWPVLVLSLEDVDGRRVGQRAFAPQEYRRGHRPGDLIAPGQSAAVQFDVIEPAPRVVAFTFDFR
jgi:hypothetical protein